MVEVVQMSLKEADRYAVIQQVIQRTMGSQMRRCGSTFRYVKSSD